MRKLGQKNYKLKKKLMSSSEFVHLKIRSYMLVKHQVEHFKNILLVHLVSEHACSFYFFLLVCFSQW